MYEKLVNYFNGNLDYKERSELFREIEKNECLKREFMKLQTTNAMICLSEQPGDPEEGQRSYSDFLKKKKLAGFQRFFISFLKYAAAIAILVVTTVLVTLGLTKEPIPVVAENAVFVPAGQRAMVKLQDGTEVWLNAQSAMVYPSQFTGAERHVTISGEAYFMVAENESMPFVVSTDQVDIKVLGTTFNINNYPDAGFSQISLIEGSLEVFNKSEEGSAVILKPDQQITLRNNEFTVEQIRYHNHFFWKDGLYCFNNETMSDILKKLAVYFDVEIIVENTSISKIEYTGKFRQTDGMDEILRILRKIQPFIIEKNEEGNIIRIK